MEEINPIKVNNQSRCTTKENNLNSGKKIRKVPCEETPVSIEYYENPYLDKSYRKPMTPTNPEEVSKKSSTLIITKPEEVFKKFPSVDTNPEEVSKKIPSVDTKPKVTSYPHWSPLDDGIEIALPGDIDTKSKSSMKDVDAYIDNFLYGPSTKKRLPVFSKFCPQ